MQRAICESQLKIGKLNFNPKVGLKPIKWIGTQRSVYTHRKKQKRIKELLAKTKPVQPQKSDKPTKPKTENKDTILTEEKKAEDEEMYVDVKTEQPELVTVLVIRRPPLLNNGLGQSFTVIAPEGYGLALLRRFVYSGCKAIGEREHCNLMLECGRRVFPFDYPQTKAGTETSLEDATS